jgi:hypothetical protein
MFHKGDAPGRLHQGVVCLRRLYAIFAASSADKIAFAENMIYNIRKRCGE